MLATRKSRDQKTGKIVCFVILFCRCGIGTQNKITGCKNDHAIATLFTIYNLLFLTQGVIFVY